MNTLERSYNTYFPHSRINYYNSVHDYLHMAFEMGSLSKGEFEAEMKQLALQEQAEREAFYKENNSDSNHHT